MKLLRFIILLIFTIPICSLAALGDDDELSFYELEEELMRTVTIATGVKQTTARAPSVTSVITAADIKATGATDLDEVLEMIPGMHVARHTEANLPIYTIRGIYSNSSPGVLMLINGIPNTRLNQGNRGWAWAGMPLEAIARIEVIRGPGSAVFGADAFAGVINVITKTKQDINGTETGVRVGNFDTHSAYLLHGDSWGGFDIATILEYNNTDGHNKIIESDNQTYSDKVNGTNASLAPESVNLRKRSIDARLDISKDNWRLRSGYQGRYDIGESPNFGNLVPSGSLDDSRFNSDLTYHNPQFTNYWDITAQLSYYQTKYATDNQMIFPAGAVGFPQGLFLDTSVSERHSYLNLSGLYSGFNKHLIRLGTGYHYVDLYDVEHYVGYGPGRINFSDTPNAFIPEGNRNNFHVFLQDIWTITQDLELTAGLRYDEYSDFGRTINPRAALVWQTNSNLITKLMYGSAFRAPMFLDLYLRNVPVGAGNSNVDPETLESWELAFDYRAADNLHLAMNLFSYSWEDRILSVLTEAQVRNIGIQDGHGLELEMRWKMNKKSSLVANYAFVKATDKELDHDAGNYPQHLAYLRTDWLLYPKWYIDAQINWVGERGRIKDDTRAPVDAYTTVDLTLLYKGIKEKHWNFSMSIRNLFDAEAYSPTPPDIHIPNDFPLAGRHYWLKFGYNF